MSDYDNQITSSDLDAFKHSGALETDLVVSGNLSSGQQKTYSTSTIEVTDPDYGQFYFDHSDLHEGKFRNLSVDRVAHIYDETNGNYGLILSMEVEVETDGVRFIGKILNPYATPITVRTTTITFRYVPYEDTVGVEDEVLQNTRVTSGGDTRVTDGADTRVTVI